jgi:hypothetical protein
LEKEIDMTRQAARQLCGPRCSAALLIISLASPALAAPTITNVSPRGLQIGQPTTLVISGSDLPADAQLIVAAKIASQTIKPGAKPDRLELDVTLDPATPPGLYPIRIAGAGGISGPLVVGVDRLPQVAFSASLDKLPVALHGTVGAGQVLKLTLAGKKDQRVVLDVEAQRLGSGLKPVVRLYDPRGTQIAWSPPRVSIGSDARIDAVLPADAQYVIELHDELYRPTGPGYFRLKVGDLNYADLALPLGATAGSKQAINFTSASLRATTELDATGAGAPGETAAPLPADERFTGAAPRVAISEFPELVEMPSAGGPVQELPQVPVGVSGVLSAAGEEDKYLLPVKPGQKLAIDVVARQFGSPLDGVLAIRDEQGKQLAMGDDRPGSSDPLVDYTVPANVSKLQLAIKDLLGRGGSDYVYRIVIREVGRPDFSLSLASDRINVPAGGTQVVPVQVARMNYNGPIELALAAQPSELQVQGNVIAPGATIGLLTVSAQNVSPQAGLTQLVGRATETQPAAVRGATFGDVPGSRYQPRIRGELGVAITRPSPVSIAWLPGDNDQLYLGGKLPARVQLTRTEGTKGKVRLRLLTSFPTPKKAVMEGKQKQKQEKTVDDLERSLRLEGDPTFGPDQKEVTVNILVPADLPRKPWDLVLVAELLSADGKNVVSSLAAPVRTLSPVSPFTLALSGPNSAEGRAGTGDSGKLAGKISRSPGYTQGIVVTLDGLPKGQSPPQVLVPGDKSEFELPLTFAYGSKAGPLKGAKLVAISAPVTATSVRSNALDVAIDVVAGEKPALEQPKEVFEDDEKFIALLTEGEGRAIPDQRDKYSGKYSLRVTPDQKFNAKLPNLGVKIRENPGPGEYRYLRFAWKKAQGNAVCLQLAHDGKFGPPEAGSSGSGREGAKFRYHSGGGDECYGASLQISDKLPGPKFELVTRDLFLDFGEFTLTGLAFSPVDGQAALFDHIYLARQMDDFELIQVKKE